MSKLQQEEMRMSQLVRQHAPEDNYGIEMGITYLYDNPIPATATGCKYRPHRLILDVPSYQWKVLVEALTGKDTGLWFTCTPNNFLTRYKKE